MGYRSFGIQVISTGTGGTFIFEGSNDNINFQSIPVFNQALVVPIPIVTAITATSSSILYVGACTFRYIRVRIASTITGGSIQTFTLFANSDLSVAQTVVAQGTAGNLNVTIGSGTITTVSTVTTVTTLSQFLASTAAADATANPTTTGIRDFAFCFNGTTWDRNYGNYNTTTTDAGAKTVSFTGVTQTNFNAKGAYVTVLCGTVTGTSPTMSATLQWSPDAGTTWLNIGPTSTAVTATGNTIVFQIYPANFSVAGATPSALTTGATSTVQINAVLPRTWRLNYTLGGTSPSFTITAVYVNYQL